MLNPVSRILQAANITEAKFCAGYQYSKQFMVDVTAGTYTRLPDSIHASLRHLSELKHLDVAALLLAEYRTMSLDLAYSLWQSTARDRNRDKFLSISPIQWTDKLSPAHFFVKQTAGTPTRFSKDLKVPPQQVRRWVSGQAKTTPESIVDALREIDYPWVHELVENQRAWIEDHS